MKVFLDSSTIIIALEVVNSNSAAVFDLVLKGEIKGIISSRVLFEVKRYFKGAKGKDYASLIVFILKSTCTVVTTVEVSPMMEELKEHIKEKDLEHVAVVKKFQIPHLIAYDDDFKKVEEYKTPRAFLQWYGLKPRNTEY